MAQITDGFSKRKADHIRHSLDPQTEAIGLTKLDTLTLTHEALPDLNFQEITLQTARFGQAVATPFLISSMTAGHQDALLINQHLMAAAEHQGWAMGVGSQRRELFDSNAHIEWLGIRKKHPKLQILGNIGIAQCITSKASAIERLVDNLQATALQIHLNPLQECMQPEGTPQFKGGLAAIEALCKQLSVPVIIKETGCGISGQTLNRLEQCGISAVDVSGLGGTHWGRIEGLRAPTNSAQQIAAQTFKNWGISTVDSLLMAQKAQRSYEIWASGGVRTGLDAAKLIALGAQTIGFARPMLEAALQSEEAVLHTMSTIEFELKTALFCTGQATISQLQENGHALLQTRTF